MLETYKFTERGQAKKSDITDFCNEFAEMYAKRESRGDLVINYSLFMMDKLKDKFYKLFRCLVNVGKPKKKEGNMCSMDRVELLWTEKEYYTGMDLNEKIFALSDILGIDDFINQESIGEATDMNDDII